MALRHDFEILDVPSFSETLQRLHGYDLVELSRQALPALTILVWKEKSALWRHYSQEIRIRPGSTNLRELVRYEVL